MKSLQKELSPLINADKLEVCHNEMTQATVWYPPVIYQCTAAPQPFVVKLTEPIYVNEDLSIVLRNGSCLFVDKHSIEIGLQNILPQEMGLLS